MKSPPVNNNFLSSASTKEATASGGHPFQQTFGIYNCIYKCEQNEIEGSPEVAEFGKEPDVNLKVSPVKMNQ